MRAVKLRCLRWLPVCGVGFTVGCASSQVALPNGHLPPPLTALDSRTTATLASSPASAATLPPVTLPPGGPNRPAYELPAGLPGGDTPLVKMPQFAKHATAAERDKAVREAYPALTPVSATTPPAEQSAVSLAELLQKALTCSPVVKQASADADAAYGQVVQAGLHPNPTVGYQADQWQPGLRIPPGGTGSGAGQQGGFINQLIKTAGKLTLAQQVAGYDYINALVAVRKAEVEVTAAVRSAYFAALVAQQTRDVNKSVADMADEVYRLLLKRVAAGEAAGYEPLQLYAQAVQARNAVTQADATYKAAWWQLAAAVGQPDLPPAPLAGKADTPAPVVDPEAAKLRMLEQHTDVLTARNAIAQAQANLALQQRIPIPDLQTNTYHQYDNLARTYQFGIQLGVELPVSDRNQGNIRTAQAKIASAGLKLAATQNALTGRLAEAVGRYEANTAVAAGYRDKVLPSLAQAYRALVRRWDVDEPGKVQFNDIVVAQQNYAQALQAYLSALDAQWKAVVDVATVTQADEIYPSGPAK